MVIMAPADEAELRQMMYTAVKHEGGPVAVRYPRGNGIGADLTEGLRELELGRSKIVREGADTMILAVGNMVQNALAAADLLAARGVEAGVVNARFVKPLDVELIDGLAAGHDLIFSVEDNSVAGGYGSAVNEALVERGHYRTACVVMGLPDRFIDHGSQEGLHAQFGLDAKGIADQVFEALKHRARRGTPAAAAVADSGVRRGPVEARAPIARAN
jgi:1-deoxy-D-xylulose-5-phosphate synthase